MHHTVTFPPRAMMLRTHDASAARVLQRKLHGKCEAPNRPTNNHTHCETLTGLQPCEGRRSYFESSIKRVRAVRDIPSIALTPYFAILRPCHPPGAHHATVPITRSSKPSHSAVVTVHWPRANGSPGNFSEGWNPDVSPDLSPPVPSRACSSNNQRGEGAS